MSDAPEKKQHTHWRDRAGQPLSDGEAKIVELRSQGVAFRWIAKMWGVSPDTVRTHYKRALVKLSNPNN